MGSCRGCPFARRPPKSGGRPGTCSTFVQLDGLSRCVQLAHHSDTWNRCSGSLRCALVAWLTKPSILPPLTSAVALVWPCGPPPFTSAWSTNGLSHLPVFAFGMHGDGLPPFVGIPLAFGYVPK